MAAHQDDQAHRPQQVTRSSRALDAQTPSQVDTDHGQVTIDTHTHTVGTDAVTLLEDVP